MLAREGWKYALVKERLIEHEINHEFEYQLPETERFFDLALTDIRLFIEFDGPYHSKPSQIIDDDEKDKLAVAAGWKVVRVKVEQASVIDPACVMSICGIV